MRPFLSFVIAFAAAAALFIAVDAAILASQGLRLVYGG